MQNIKMYVQKPTEQQKGKKSDGSQNIGPLLETNYNNINVPSVANCCGPNETPSQMEMMRIWPILLLLKCASFTKLFAILAFVL